MLQVRPLTPPRGDRFFSLIFLWGDLAEAKGKKTFFSYFNNMFDFWGYFSFMVISGQDSSKIPQRFLFSILAISFSTNIVENLKHLSRTPYDLLFNCGGSNSSTKRSSFLCLCREGDVSSMFIASILTCTVPSRGAVIYVEVYASPSWHTSFSRIDPLTRYTITYLCSCIQGGDVNRTQLDKSIGVNKCLPPSVPSISS